MILQTRGKNSACNYLIGYIKSIRIQGGQKVSVLIILYAHIREEDDKSFNKIRLNVCKTIA